MKRQTQRIPTSILGPILKKQHFRTYYLLSACLAGVKCRYDGAILRGKSFLPARGGSEVAHQGHLKRQLLQGKSFLLVCPEKLGGLPIPHPPAQIVSNNPKIRLKCGGNDVWKNRARVLTQSGKDFTNFFKKGARQVKCLVQLLNIKTAYLKSRSPSCGCGCVYNRHPLIKKPVLVKGDGVLTALLKKCGVRVISIN